MRIGYGWDSHEFKRGLPLVIGGVRLPHSHGLAGHSDGDVLLHALTDALLGAVAAGDIGSYFPPSDKKWKGANSVIFLKEALRASLPCSTFRHPASASRQKRRKAWGQTTPPSPTWPCCWKNPADKQFAWSLELGAWS